MSKTKAIIGVCLIFILGIITGVSLTIKLVDNRVHDLAAGGPEKLGEVIVRRLDHELRLTGEQRAKIEQIVNSNRDKIKVLREQIQPQVVKLMESSTKDIRAVLTPEQATKFDQIIARIPPGRWRHAPGDEPWMRDHPGRDHERENGWEHAHENRPPPPDGPIAPPPPPGIPVSTAT